MEITADSGAGAIGRPTVLIRPGWNGSGAGLRPSIGQRRRPELVRVEPEEWSRPLPGASIGDGGERAAGGRP